MREYILKLLFIVAILFFSFAFYIYIKDSSLSQSSPLNPNIIKNIHDKTPGADINNSGSNNTESKLENSRNDPKKSETVSEDTYPDTKTSLKQLPSDINITNCGFYYREYGVCAGQCPEGKCISEGRSCYCRNA
jgi:hypothetical protein